MSDVESFDDNYQDYQEPIEEEMQDVQEDQEELIQDGIQIVVLK